VLKFGFTAAFTNNLWSVTSESQAWITNTGLKRFSQVFLQKSHFRQTSTSFKQATISLVFSDLSLFSSVRSCKQHVNISTQGFAILGKIRLWNELDVHIEPDFIGEERWYFKNYFLLQRSQAATNAIRLLK